MDIDRMTLARARLEIHMALPYLFDRRRKINLIDLGWKETEGRRHEGVLAIRFHVDEKPPPYKLEDAGISPLPPSFGPFERDVIIGRDYRLHQWSWWGGGWEQRADPRTSRADPMRGGISISDQYHYSAGTLGGKVIERTTGAEMILSNWHVLVAEWTARPGQFIYQPGRLDGGKRADTVATLTRDAMSANLDAAVATLTGSRRLINDQVDLGPVTGVGQVRLGMEVVKSGRTTRKTYGIVTGVEGTAPMRYRYVERNIRHVITIDRRYPGETVSAGGDSGAIWCDLATKQAIGLHFAGSDRPERALAMDMQSVLDALNVDIVA